MVASRIVKGSEPRRSWGLLLAVVLLVGGARHARAEADEGVKPEQEGLQKGGRLLVVQEGIAMPHERPHLGDGLIPVARYFDWKVRVATTQELEYFAARSESQPLNAQTMWGINEYLSNDRTGFMAQPLAGPYGTSFMVNQVGLGLQVGVWNEWVYLSLGLQEATANGQYPDFKSLARGDLAYFAEFGVTPDYGGPNEGAYRITYSYIGRTGSGPFEGPGSSLVVSAKQRIVDQWGLFGRYTQSFERLPEESFQLAVVAGFVHLQPFGFSSDRVGLAYIYDRPTDTTLRSEHGGELYWRFQLTQIFSVTPDLQVYFTPSKALDDDFSTIVIPRLQLAI